jgi:hypothetical protein
LYLTGIRELDSCGSEQKRKQWRGLVNDISKLRSPKEHCVSVYFLLKYDSLNGKERIRLRRR